MTRNLTSVNPNFMVVGSLFRASFLLYKWQEIETNLLYFSIDMNCKVVVLY